MATAAVNCNGAPSASGFSKLGRGTISWWMQQQLSYPLYSRYGVVEVEQRAVTVMGTAKFEIEKNQQHKQRYSCGSSVGNSCNSESNTKLKITYSTFNRR